MDRVEKNCAKKSDWRLLSTTHACSIKKWSIFARYSIFRNGKFTDYKKCVIQISYRWSELCQEHLNERKRLPVIDYFNWTTYRDGANIFSTKILEINRTFLGLKSWNYCDYEDDSVLNYIHFNNQASSQYFPYLWHFSKNASDEKLIDRLSRIFDRCSTIEYLYCDMWQFQRKEEFDLIQNSMLRKLSQCIRICVDKLSLAKDPSKERMCDFS